ncbi:hypothetical protein DENSPDRAFT_516836 [Dentipellis sp. KUC8613]|nr:hypothetical protein DENSPDRAFT_516836 [Dentipellis sp. KUC8613]
MSTSSNAIDIFGLITGILSTLAIMAHLIRMFLPSVKMQELDELLTETDTLFYDAREQGLLTEQSFVRQTQEQLNVLRYRALCLRSNVHSATTGLQQCVAMAKGLSLRIVMMCKEVKIVRARISTTSVEEKMRLQESASRACDTPETPMHSSNSADNTAQRRLDDRNDDVTIVRRTNITSETD